LDIDGVLVDIRKSYNAAIKETVEYVLKFITGNSFQALVTDQIILKFRQSGGFNNDIDTSYAIILAILANPPKNLSQGREFLAKVAENCDESGYVSVEKFLAIYDIDRWKKILAILHHLRKPCLHEYLMKYFMGLICSESRIIWSPNIVLLAGR
jgi:hypothetical protein